MFKRVLTLLPFVAAAFLYSAYKEGFLDGLAGGIAKNKGAEAVTLTSQDANVSAKLQPFIVCINRVDTKMLQNIALYRQHFKLLAANPAAPMPLAIERFSSFKIAVYEQGNSFITECAAGLEKSTALPPSDDELDGLARSYADTLRALVVPMNAADTYYSQKDYIDDKMATGRKLDAAMSPLFDKVAALSATMRAAVAIRDDRLRDARLAAIEKQRGRTLDWHTLNMMIESRRSLAKLESASGNKTLTKETVGAVEQTLQAAFDGAQTMAAKTGAPADAAKGPKPLWFSIQSNAAGMLAAVKELRRELDTGKAAADPAMRLNRIVSAYNDLVRTHNMVARF
jgi:hypothetical protein